MERHTENTVAGQVALVAGAASGIGAAIAQELAARGVVVACLDVDDVGCARTVAAVVEAGGEATAHRLDVTDEASVRDVVGDICGRSPVQILVNTVGITGVTGITADQVAVDDFDLVYRVNLRGALLLSQAVLPSMTGAGYGRILHLASIAGKDGNAGMAAYSATKAGLIGLVKSMGKDYAQTGVTVNALAPAVIHTPLVEAMPEHQVTYMTDRIPMARLGRLDEVAAMAAWIVSPACSFTTGFTFDLSGGRAVY